jgi:uncharacterized protein
MAFATTLATLAAAAAAPAPVPATEFNGFSTTTVEIQSRLGRARFAAYLAVTPAQQERGLMFVKELPAGTGMLFPQPTPRIMTMWMKNTLIALDMVFIAADGHVACVQRHAVPQSLDIISCDVPVWAVLELADGRTQEFGIEVGDRVLRPTYPH